MISRRAVLEGVILTPLASLPLVGRRAGQSRRDASRPIDVRSFGARGDGVNDDRGAIQRAIDTAHANGGGEVVVPPGTYLVGSAIIPRSKVSLRGLDRRRSILRAKAGSVDNVVGIDYLVSGEMAARAAGKVLTSYSSPGFGADLSEGEARSQGGFAGYGLVDFHLRELTIDGNKQNCPENGNMLCTERILGEFTSGQWVRGSSGGTAMVSACFSQGTPKGISIRPSTRSGTFDIGDLVTGPTGSMKITARQADDAYQVGVVLQAATRCSIKDCIIKDTVFHGVVIYNFCNDILIDGNEFLNPNKRDTKYISGTVHLYSDFSNADLVINRNRFLGGLGYGVVISETGGKTLRPTISHNSFQNIPDDAIRISSDASSSGVIIERPRIIGNRIEMCGNVAIRCYHNGIANGIYRPLVAGNMIRHSLYGILFIGRVFDGRVENNSISAVAKAPIDLGPASAGNSIGHNVM